MRAPGTGPGEGIRVVRTSKISVFAALTVAVGLAGCSRDDVTHFRVAKTPDAPAVAPAAMAPVEGASFPATPQGGALRWTLPAGWSEKPGGQMRYATLQAPVTGRIDASVVVLPGPAGGELANVNRWRNQIGLAPLDDGALAKARHTVKTKAGALRVYDFTNTATPPARVVAGLTEAKGSTWFVKMTGDATAVAAAHDDFMKLLGSLRFE
jgi:hypothetical protein